MPKLIQSEEGMQYQPPHLRVGFILPISWSLQRGLSKTDLQFREIHMGISQHARPE